MRYRRVLVRGPALAGGALACALILAACGASTSTSSSGSGDPGVKFADCMRANGVSSFPDPSPGGGINIPNGVNPRSPAFESAQTKCFELLPHGGPSRGQASEQRKVEMLKLSRCMRSHGITSFPDPTTSPPNPARGFGSGGGIAFGSPGSFIAVSQSMMDSPGFQQAAAACGFPGGGHLPGKRSSVIR